MRTAGGILFLVLTMYVADRAHAQSAADTASPSFPETAGLRAQIAALDSSRVTLTATSAADDSLAAIAASAVAREQPWEIVGALRTWTGRFPRATDSLLGAGIALAATLNDSAGVLRTLDIQRSVVHVDSVLGAIDLIPAAAQRICRVRAADSTFRFVQFDNPHELGDTVAVYATPFGRKIYLARTTPSTWQMMEGGLPPVGPDSVFDVLREVPRPRAYEQYDRFAARFTALRGRLEPPLRATLDTLAARMRTDAAVLAARVAALARESANAARDLRREDFFLTARDRAAHGRRVEAVDALERLLAEDSLYAGAADALAQLRREIDSTTRADAFGADGLRGMVIIPDGEVLLRTGERFRPDPFFIDSVPVSADVYQNFEAATGYRSHGRWRDNIVDRDSLAVEAVRGLTAEDRVAFARWAGKRPASPQEQEYVTASGFPTIAQRQQHASVPNLYHVAIDPDGFFCVRGVSALPDAAREQWSRRAQERGRDVRDAVEAAH